MPTPLSAGILLFRQGEAGVEVLLGHPGGPFWRSKDEGAWMIPKGQVEEGERPIEAALREFEEETGTRLTSVPFPLARVRQAGGKVVEAFAVEGDLDPAALRSLEFGMEWPPKSGQQKFFPEIDRAEWMSLADARRRMLPSQLPLIEALEKKLS